ncbi:MAG: hypothetical protein M1839_005840 [Geoglossum umbratile]|nr:MAG: hypothetical protein M1839_005840 [Geoglossum umbratile]
MSKPRDYTVGWICAITTEYVAARAFLDEEHKGPEYVSLHDDNNYTLGKIGEHNTVIAVLPDGEYGISSATGVAKDMLHSFPNIRIGLMVGVGGGAPSQKHDIRLGDIVVSAPRDGGGGVFQYDFGKTIQDQSFRATGFLNQPPKILRTAVSGLKSQYEGKGCQIEEAINSILEKNPRLQKKYKRPDPSNDRLYQTGATHPPNDEASCTAVCSNDSSNLIPRCERAKYEDNPAIHYGLIASADQLMKDALLRDKFAKEKGVLCFEMEAAGLMNQFPCLVIRGICDYSDTHKNKEWQGYAAMAAAAYAKDLLYQIPPNKVEAEKEISDLLSSVLDTVSETRTNIEIMRSKLDRDEDLKILNWLTPVNYGSQQSDFIKRRQEGTGTWLLHANEFNTWLEKKNKTLFCPGIPGAGKTILAAIVVNHLNNLYTRDPTTGLAYIYCNFRQQDEQKPEDLLLSLLKQFAQEQPFLPESVKTLYECHNPKLTRPTFNEIEEALLSAATYYSRAFIIVDALDECGVSDGGCKEFLSAIFHLQAKTGANIFATSRINNDIAMLFGTALSLQILANEKDVESYLDGQMSLLQSDILDDDLRDRVRREVVRAVDGMFLLAQLHMNNLMDQPTKGDIKQALQHLAKGINGLDKTYEQAMERINNQGNRVRELAEHILGWIIHAKRPLSTAELQHALGVRTCSTKLDEDYLPSVRALRSVCAGLVAIDEQSGIVRLVHYTTQQYFERTWASWFPNAQTYITDICVTYLSFDIFETGFCQSDREFEARLENNVLYDYAARNWGHHAHLALVKEDLILNLLESRAKVSAASQAMMASRSYSGYSQRVPRQVTGVHVAAYFGLVESIMGLLEKEYNPDLQDSDGRTPLSWAAWNGHGAVVKLLLATEKVDLDSKDSDRRTPLLQAAQKGHEAVVKLLLPMEKVDLDSKDSGGRTPLSWAAWNGHEAVVKLLLATEKVDLDSKDSDGRTPLLQAAQKGYEAVVKLLLPMEKVDPDSKDSGGRTPLSWAAWNGHEAVVKLLLATEKVDPDSKDSDGRTPLSSAALKGHEAVVELLLATEKVDLDSKDSYGQTPLLWAAWNGHEAVVKLLLATEKVDLESKDSGGRTPLSSAAFNGREAVVKLLLAMEKVDLDSKGSDGQTPLSWAAINGHEAVVKLLLATEKVDPESKDSGGQTPLSLAAWKGHEAVVKLLLATEKVDPDSKGSDGQTPLSSAAWKGHEAVVKLLLATEKVNPDSKDSDGRTPLSLAAWNGHEAVVKLLLVTEKVDPDSKGSYGRTPLSLAAINGHEAVVKLLLATEKVNPDSKDSDGRTPLSWAAINGHEAVVKLLLATEKVDMDSKDSGGRTPLSWAAWNGHEAVVKLLLATEKVDLDSKDSYRQTPLSWAAWNGHEAVVELLLAREKVDLDSKDSYGQTPLSLAARKGHEAVVKLLLATEKVDLNSKDSGGRTPLSSAAWNGHEAVVKLLLATEKVDPDSKDSGGRTPLLQAARKGHEAVVKLLLATEKVDLNSKDSGGRTPLLQAARNGHEAVVKLLQSPVFKELSWLTRGMAKVELDLHLDLNTTQYVKDSSGGNLLSSSIAIDDEQPDGCTIVVPGFHHHIHEWHKGLIDRGEDTAGYTNNCSAAYRAQDRKDWGELVPMPCPALGLRLTRPEIIHGSTPHSYRRRRSLFAWHTGIDDTHTKLDLKGTLSWNDLATCHRDLEAPSREPSGQAPRYGLPGFRFPGSIIVGSSSAIGDALIGRRKWTDPQVLQERDILLGDNNKAAHSYVSWVRAEMVERFKEAFKQLEVIETEAFGENSYFHRKKFGLLIRSGNDSEESDADSPV